jgi:hypothetical protein
MVISVAGHIATGSLEIRVSWKEQTASLEIRVSWKEQTAFVSPVLANEEEEEF